MPAPLYAKLLGPRWTDLADPVRRLHTTGGSVRAHGWFRIEHGPRRIGRLVTWMLRLPAASAAADTRLTVTTLADGERWQRIFDERRLVTRQYAAGPSELGERFGPLDFRFRLDVSGGRLLYTQRDVTFVLGRLRLPVPASWAPSVEAREEPAGPHSVAIDVRVRVPRLGALITYQGTVALEDVGV